MNLEQAAGNIDIVLQNAQMKRVEHEEVFNNLKFLVARAQKVDELEKELKELKEKINNSVFLQEQALFLEQKQIIDEILDENEGNTPVDIKG